MKKIISLLMVLIMSLGLVACGGDANKENAEDSTEETIEHTYVPSGSVAVLGDKVEDVSGGIKITVENWSDYLEIVSEEEEILDEDGEFVGLRQCNYLKVKDDYVLSEENVSNLSLECMYSTEKRWYAIDKEDGEIIRGSAERGQDGNKMVVSVSSEVSEYPFALETVYSAGTDGIMNYYMAGVNFRIVNIQGVLYIE